MDIQCIFSLGPSAQICSYIYISGYFGFCFAVILIHASLRMRSIKNKITNKMEYVGLKRTPMGIILEGLGQEQEAGS